LLDKEGNILPTYWVNHAYARMNGTRLRATDDLDRRVQTLASYDPAARALTMLVANDCRYDTTISLQITHPPAKKATAVIARFRASGYDTLSTIPLATTRKKAIALPSFELSAGEAYRITVDFSDKRRK
jgi:hypothetical protein